MQTNSQLLRKLTNCYGPSGRESTIATLITDELSGHVDEVSIDSMGNVIARNKGNGKKLMFAAHMDQIGMIITDINQKGFLRFARVGGLDPKSLIGQRVVFDNNLSGVVCAEATKDPTLANLYIDVASLDPAYINSSFRVGDICTCKAEFIETDDCIICSAADNRTGCYVLIEAAKRQHGSEFDIYYVFTVQEEVGRIGIAAAVSNIKPDICIAVDVAIAGDSPKKPKNSLVLGGGAAVKVKDLSILSHHEILNKLVNLAQDKEIRFQHEVTNIGMTDVGVAHKMFKGIKGGGISIPCRNIHTPGELISKTDLQECIKLVIAFANYGV